MAGKDNKTAVMRFDSPSVNKVALIHKENYVCPVCNFIWINESAKYCQECGAKIEWVY